MTSPPEHNSPDVGDVLDSTPAVDRDPQPGEPGYDEHVAGHDEHLHALLGAAYASPGPLVDVDSEPEDGGAGA